MIARCLKLDRTQSFTKIGEHYGTAKQVWQDIDNCDGAHEITHYGDSISGPRSVHYH